MKRLSFLLITLLLSHGSAPALTMEEAWELVIENYEDVKVLCLDNYQAKLNTKRVISLLLPRITADAALTYSNPSRDVEGSRLVPQSLKTGSLKVSQAIIDLSIRPAYLITKYASQATKCQAEFELNEILFITSETFLAVLQTAELLKVCEDQLHLTEMQCDATNARYENGEVPVTDLLSVKKEVNRAKRTLFEVQDTLKIHQDHLGHLIGQRACREPLISPPLDLEKQRPSLDDLIEEGTKRREDLKSLCAQMLANQSEVQALCRKNWPKLSFAGEYTLATPETLALRNNSWSAAFWLSIPLFDGGMNRLDVRNAQTQLSKTKLLYSRKLKDLKLQLTSTYLEIESRIQNLDLLRQEQELAHENYAILFERYEEGLAGHLDLKAAFHDYIAAETHFTNARYALSLLELRLKKEAGFFDEFLQRCL